jgi:hypothetical protein
MTDDAGPAGNYPPTIAARDWWVAWILDGHDQKRPVAPWQTGHAYPVEWSQDLDGDDRPETDFETARRWTKDFDLADLNLSLPEDAHSDSLRLGLILPADRPPREDRIILIDWDDVRDPETGEIHPVAAAYIDQYGGYVEVSRSGEGLHQYLIGGLRKRGKFIAPIDDEPFVGDDLPQVEIYDGGRHVAMTGDKADIGGDDAVPGQECIDELVREYADAEKDAGHRRYDPESGEASSGSSSGDGSNGGEVPEPDTGEYGGPDLADLRQRKPEDRSLAYHAVVEAFYRGAGNADGYAGILNWRLEGLAAALGEADGLSAQQVIDDLGGAYLDETPVEQGCRHETPHRVQYAYERAQNGRGIGAPSHDTLAEYGVLPEDMDDDAEPVAVLPPAVQDLATATSGWDWRHSAREGQRSLSIADARERTVRTIADAYERGDRTLIEALPTMGKSYGAVKAAAETGQPVTVLTGRGREEQYEQFGEWAHDHGLDAHQLPAFTDTCPTAAGEHGDEWRELVMRCYRRGATPQQIHNLAEAALGRPLPCQVAETGEAIECQHRHAWQFDPDEYDILIGHYLHAHTQQATAGRTVVIDEFAGGAYETVLDAGRLQRAVSAYLQRTDAVPFDDYTDLVENRDDDRRRADALLHFIGDDGEVAAEPDARAVFDDDGGHALAPVATAALLIGEDLGNGFEWADLGDGGRAVFNRRAAGNTDAMTILQPPALEYADGVVALDGTPTPRMWDLALDEHLTQREVLAADERADYLEHALNLNLVRTTGNIKPYNSPAHVSIENDAALLDRIADEHGQQPSVITTSTAEAEYADAGVLDHVDETKHYGNVLGSNEFDDTRLGAVIGSNHYGDHYIKKWGAYAGEAVERNDGKGADLSYSGFGDDILTHMREHDTLQAAMRFGRDGNGAVVYVHTDTLPDWVPIAGEGRVLKTWSDGMKGVIRALEDLDTATTAEVVAHDAVGISRQQVSDHLGSLRTRGVVDSWRDPEDGRRLVWDDDGLHRLGDHGDVALDGAEVKDSDGAEVRKPTRRVHTIRASLRTSSADDGVATDEVADGLASPARAAMNGGDPPPDGAD